MKILKLVLIIFLILPINALKADNEVLKNKITKNLRCLICQGQSVYDSDSDKFYLLNIWSSWCVPCKQEHPILMELMQNDNLKVIGLNYKDTKKNAINFLKELGNPYDNIIFDNKGTNAIEWGAYGVPESFLINNNKIIKKYIGPLNKRSIEEIKSFIK
jgi:cytochrome c biogenesis protein CcmG/thiol:disulfide interchange protein DsbE